MGWNNTHTHIYIYIYIYMLYIYVYVIYVILYHISIINYLSIIYINTYEDIYTHISLPLILSFFSVFSSSVSIYPRCASSKAQKRDEGWEIASEDSENP